MAQGGPRSYRDDDSSRTPRGYDARSGGSRPTRTETHTRGPKYSNTYDQGRYDRDFRPPRGFNPSRARSKSPDRRLEREAAQQAYRRREEDRVRNGDRRRGELQRREDARRREDEAHHREEADRREEARRCGDDVRRSRYADPCLASDHTPVGRSTVTHPEFYRAPYKTDEAEVEANIADHLDRLFERPLEPTEVPAWNIRDKTDGELDLIAQNENVLGAYIFAEIARRNYGAPDLEARRAKNAEPSLGEVGNGPVAEYLLDFAVGIEDIARLNS